MSRTIVGTPAELVDTIGQYRDAGFDDFILLGMTLGKDAERRSEQYDRFAAEVAAHL